MIPHDYSGVFIGVIAGMIWVPIFPFFLPDLLWLGILVYFIIAILMALIWIKIRSRNKEN